MKVYYFGCPPDGGKGRYMHHEPREPWRSNCDAPAGCPWSFGSPENIDGGLAPRAGAARQRQGAVALHHREGWTAIAWWDRSADVRPGSNVAFLIDAELGLEEALTAARQAWPKVFARFRYEVKAL